jgi:hypothetical protein
MNTARRFIASFLVLSVLLTPTVLAQDPNERQERITLSPAVSRPVVAAGDTYKDTIEVINDGTTDYSFTVYSAPFSVKDEAYDPDFITVNERTRAFEWIEFGREVYSLKAGERVTVPYTISVPEKATPGGHYAVIFAEAQPEANSQIARKKRVGNLVYLSVDGETSQAGRLLDASTRLLNTAPPINTDVRIENTGNIHYDARVGATYRGIFGKQYLTYSQEVIVLPGTTRRVPITWDKPPYAGIFRVTAEASYLGRTEKLDTHYVILLPMPLRIVLALILLALIANSIFNKRKKGKASGNDKEDVVQTETEE